VVVVLVVVVGSGDVVVVGGGDVAVVGGVVVPDTPVPAVVSGLVAVGSGDDEAVLTVPFDFVVVDGRFVVRLVDAAFAADVVGVELGFAEIVT